MDLLEFLLKEEPGTDRAGDPVLESFKTRRAGTDALRMAEKYGGSNWRARWERCSRIDSSPDSPLTVIEAPYVPLDNFQQEFWH